MKPANILFLFAVLNLLAGTGHTRTRDEVLNAAAAYTTFNWPMGANNILDVKKYVTTSTTPVNGQDGIDDRMGVIINLDGNTVIDINDISEQNIKNWPFVVGSTVTGEAYAWGYGHHLTAAMKNPLAYYAYKSFQEYLAEGRVAGARDAATKDRSGNKIGGLGNNADFTGLDCSGFVTRALGFKGYHYNTTELIGYSLPISTTDIRPGDIIDSAGNHVALFVEWIDKPRIARIVHASYWHFSERKYK